MPQTSPPVGGTTLSRRNRGRLFAALLALDAVVTLFPPLYWAAGGGDDPTAVLFYLIGGGAIVLASVFVMYGVETVADRRASSEGERP